MTEFKVGDLVVLLSREAEFDGIYKIWEHEDTGCLVLDEFEMDVWVSYKQIRHATHEEIKAGRRL